MIKADPSAIASANDDMPQFRAMKRPNAIHPSLMKPAERRAELCAILGLGIVGTYIARIYDEVKGRPRFIGAERAEAPVTASASPRSPSP